MMITWRMNVRGCAVSNVTNSLTSNFMPFGHSCHEVIDPGPGLYAMWLRGQCLYVGMSEDLRRRISQHEVSEDNQDLADHCRLYSGEIRIAVVHVDAEAVHLHRLESEAIDQLQPLLNKRGGRSVPQ